MLAVGAIGAAEVDDGPRLEAAAAVAGLEPLAAAEAADAAWTLATARVRLGRLLSEGAARARPRSWWPRARARLLQGRRPTRKSWMRSRSWPRVRMAHGLTPGGSGFHNPGLSSVGPPVPQ
jgi:hypothetical protein